jgi:hypothetical protein
LEVVSITRPKGGSENISYYLKNILLHKKKLAEKPNNITNIGNQKVYCVGNNYYIETEYKKLYPTQVLLVYCPPILLKSIPVSTYQVVAKHDSSTLFAEGIVQKEYRENTHRIQ